MTSPADPPRLVALSGSLTLANAGVARASLLAGLDAGAILVDCGGVEEADVTAVQLLLAARLSARRRLRGFALAAPLPPALAEAFDRCGLPDPGLEIMEESR